MEAPAGVLLCSLACRALYSVVPLYIVLFILLCPYI